MQRSCIKLDCRTDCIVTCYDTLLFVYIIAYFRYIAKVITPDNLILRDEAY